MPNTHTEARPLNAAGSPPARSKRTKGLSTLNDKQLRNATVPEGYSVWRLADGGGLCLVVTRKADNTISKLWRLRYRLQVKGDSGPKRYQENDYSIGAYPAVPLSEARAERDRLKKIIAAGQSPTRYREQEREQAAEHRASTFEVLSNDWLNALDVAPRTLRQRKNAIENHLWPEFGKDRPIRDITTKMIGRAIRRIARGTTKGAGGPQMARLILQCLEGIFQRAVENGDIKAHEDPTLHHRGNKTLKTPAADHHRPLEEREIGPFLRAVNVDAGDPLTRAAMRLAFLTLVRSNEVIGARWTEFDLDSALWVIPAHRMKMRKDHRVPLPQQAVEILRGLKAISGGVEFVFPNRKDRARPASHGLLWKAVARLDGGKYAGSFSPHGIRATGSTMLNASNVIKGGFNRDWIERQLAHREKNSSRAAYNQADYIEERRPMMEQWAAYLDRLERGAALIQFPNVQRA